MSCPPAAPPGMARYRFVVQDTGIGMGAEFAEHIFEPFSRGGDSGRAEGGGLGLSITKGLIDLMGGEISVETREHMGSTFRVELEFEPADAGPGPEYGGGLEDSGQECALSGRCFLVAEDNAINAEILCELLQMQGALSVVRSDGAQALAAFQEAAVGTYDAILMDIQMPNMNGYEAARGDPQPGPEGRREHPHYRHDSKRICRGCAGGFGGRYDRTYRKTHRSGNSAV